MSSSQKLSLISSPVLAPLLSSGQVWLGRDTPLAVSAPEIPGSFFQRCLTPGFIHEWAFEDSSTAQRKHGWVPPLLLITQVVATFAARPSGGHEQRKTVAWVGKRCWPHPTFLRQVMAASVSTLLPPPQFIFVDVSSPQERLQTLLEILRSPAVSIVVADGSGFDLKTTRRLQLAAKRGHTLGLMMRPARELHLLSAAQTRWKVSPLISSSFCLKWSVELLRWKGGVAPLSWLIENNGSFEEYYLNIFPAVANRSASLPMRIAPVFTTK